MYTTQTITQTLDTLTESEKHTLFQLISDHGELLDKIVPGLPLISHARGQQVLDHALAAQYDAWSNAKT